MLNSQMKENISVFSLQIILDMQRAKVDSWYQKVMGKDEKWN